MDIRQRRLTIVGHVDIGHSIVVDGAGAVWLVGPHENRRVRIRAETLEVGRGRLLVDVNGIRVLLLE